MLFLSVLTIIALLFGYMLNKRYEHPICLFCGIWSFVFVLFQIPIFEKIPISDETLTILFVMIVSFVFGSLFYVAYRQRKRREKGFIYGQMLGGRYKLNYTAFWILCFITVLVLLIDEISLIISMLHGASFLDLMRVAGGKQTIEIKGSFKVFIYMFIVHPISVCVNPICAVEYFTRIEKKWKYLVVNLIIVALNVVHHGGRNAIIVFCICYFLSWTMLGNKIQLSKKQKKYIKILFGFAAILIVIISSSRGIQDIWLSFYAYFICCIPLSTIYLQYPFVQIHKTVGFMSFKGIFYPLNTLINKIGISLPVEYSYSSTISSLIEDNYSRIGDYHATGMNAFLPAGAYFYIDGGYLFEIIGMFAYGVFATFFFYKAKNRFDKKSLAAFVMIGYALVLSFTRLYFASYQHMLGLIYILTFMYCDNRKIRRRK